MRRMDGGKLEGLGLDHMPILSVYCELGQVSKLSDGVSFPVQMTLGGNAVEMKGRTGCPRTGGLRQKGKL